MRKLINFLPVVLVSLLLVASCSSIIDAKKVSDKFMEALKNKNYESAVALVGEDGLLASSKEEWIEAFKTNFESYGEIKDFSSGNIRTSTNNGVTIAKVYYTVNYKDKNQVMYVLITLIKNKENAPFKVLGFKQKNTESALDSGL